MTDTTDRLEIKATAGNAAGDITGMFSEFMSAFEEFKRTNDGRLSDLERRGTTDALSGRRSSGSTPCSTTPRARWTA